MKKNYSKLLLALVFQFALCSSMLAQTSRQYSVLTWATVNESSPSITVHFEDDNLATSYQIYRKDLGSQGWGSPIKTMTSAGTGNLEYMDENVVAGKSYEYFIYKIGSGSFRGYGYLNAGINLEADHQRGTLLLILDKGVTDSIATEVEMMKLDLVGDGYQVVEYIVTPDIKHDSIKKHIDAIAAMYTDLRSIYIFGDVAVPYSGTYCTDNFYTVPPDGHKAGVGDHCGAWAADVYYAIPDGQWTDEDTVFYGSRYTWNQNDKGDGKYDEIELPGDVAYELGRVDLHNMGWIQKPAMDLLKQYIEKNHRYRYRIDKPYTRALIDENFNPSTEAFAGNGYRNFAAMVGQENIIEADFMNTLQDSTFIWAYGTGPGSFTSAGGIGNTKDFNTKQGAATFNFLFGSFFGDWDNFSAFLRAPLALENGGLTNAWAGRPWWHVHPMALNQSIGYCTKLVQNNVDEYATQFFRNNIHVALMGDPTLRMHMFAPPTDIQTSVDANRMKVTLSWTASTENVDGYNVYFAVNKYGPYYIANANLITGTSYTHNAVGTGTFYYMVRAQRKETTLSGSFQNLSQGPIVMVDNLVTSGVDALNHVEQFSIYPNPTADHVNIAFQTSDFITGNMEVTDLNGRVMRQQAVRGIGSQVVEVDLSGLTPGTYLIRLLGNTRLLVKQ